MTKNKESNSFTITADHLTIPLSLFLIYNSYNEGSSMIYIWIFLFFSAVFRLKPYWNKVLYSNESTNEDNLSE